MPGWSAENYPRLAELRANAPGPVRLPASRSLVPVRRSRVPAGEVGEEEVVENTGLDLQEKVGAADHRICCFLTIRWLMTRLTASLAVAVEIGSPPRRRSQ
jgi:hypothetical protein